MMATKATRNLFTAKCELDRAREKYGGWNLWSGSDD